MITRSQLQKFINLFTVFSSHFTVFVVINLALWIVWRLVYNVSFDFQSGLAKFTMIWLGILVIHLLITWYNFRNKKNN
jgi:hypothetical protein